jgi:hypothetical protein
MINRSFTNSLEGFLCCCVKNAEIGEELLDDGEFTCQPIRYLSFISIYIPVVTIINHFI